MLRIKQAREVTTLRETSSPKLSVSSRNSVGALHHFACHGHELIQACARNDDRVTTTVRFLGDTHKAASFVFSEFNVEMLAFDLEFFRDNYVIHDDWEGCHLKPYDT